MLGLGHDVVDVPAFAKQLNEPGTRMRNLFSMREIWQTAQRSQLKHDDEAVHLAARWAGKEAFLKAWCAAISRHAKDGAEVAYPYTLDNFPWVRIEILDDSHGVPRVILSSEVQRKVQQSLGLPLDPVRQSYDISISISHDGRSPPPWSCSKSEMPFPLAKVGGMCIIARVVSCRIRT